MNRASPKQARDAMEVARAMLEAGVRFVPVAVLNDDQAAQAQALSAARLARALEEAEAAEADPT